LTVNTAGGEHTVQKEDMRASSSSLASLVPGHGKGEGTPAREAGDEHVEVADRTADMFVGASASAALTAPPDSPTLLPSAPPSGAQYQPLAASTHGPSITENDKSNYMNQKSNTAAAIGNTGASHQNGPSASVRAA
jgi:hypothetical protein